MLRLARASGLPTVAEAFADRAYQADGSLVPRGEDGAVLHDPDVVAARAVRMVLEGVVVADDGSQVRVTPDSVCVHGDTPGAVSIATAVRAGLEAAGVQVASFAPAR